MPGRIAVEAGIGLRDYDGGSVGESRFELGAGEHALGHQQLARIDPRQRGGEPGGGDRLNRERTRRDVEPGESKLALGVAECREEVVAPRF